MRESPTLLSRGPATLRVLCFLPQGRLAGQIEGAGTVIRDQGWGQLFVHHASSWEDLERKGMATSADLFVVDPCADPDHLTQMGAVARLVQRFPGVPVVAFPSARRVSVGAWLRLGALGVTEVLDEEEVGGPYGIAHRIRRFSGLADSYEVIEALAGTVPTRWRRVLQRAYPLAHRELEDDDRPALSVPFLAELWMRGATPAQLHYALGKDNLPPPGWIIRWLLTLRALMLRPARRTWGAVAIELGFGSADALRRFAKRFVGSPPSRTSSEQLVKLLRDQMVARGLERERSLNA